MRNDPINSLGSPQREWLRLFVLLVMCAGWLVPGEVFAQTPASPQEETVPAPEPSTDPFSDLLVPGMLGVCPPPSTQERIMIGVGALALAAICFFLLVRIIERRFIQKDRSATLGRHLGISLTLFVSALGLLALVYLVTSCLHSEFVLWLAFCGALWLVHGAYTLIVARGN